MLELYRNIKKRREELGLSQEELAKKMGYKSRSSINKIEMGQNDIPQSKIVLFAQALETTPSALMGWDDAAEPQPSKFASEDDLNDKSAQADSKTPEKLISFEQAKLTEYFEGLNYEGQQMALQFVENLKKSGVYEPHPSKDIPFVASGGKLDNDTTIQAALNRMEEETACNKKMAEERAAERRRKVLEKYGGGK